MPDNLSIREAAFAAQYVAKHGNGTQAAIAAGYAPTAAHVAASRLIRREKVKKRIERLTRRHEISAERVLTRLDNLSAKAEESGNYPAAVRAEELLGKALGMWVDRSVSVNVDLSMAHLDALRALAARRPAKSGNDAGDDAKTVDGQATTADNGNAVKYYNMHYGKSGGSEESPKNIVDQRVSFTSALEPVATPVTDVDGNNI